MTPLLGDYAVVATHGLAARAIRWGTESFVNHAYVYVGDGWIMEANPGGAALAKLAECDDLTIWSTGRLGMTLNDDQRHRIVMTALSFAGTKYGWLDIIAITLAQRRLGHVVNSRTWWVRRLQSMRSVICSQLVDDAYKAAGADLFPGREPGLVSPGDLLNRLTRDTASTTRKAA